MLEGVTLEADQKFIKHSSEIPNERDYLPVTVRYCKNGNISRK